MGDYIPFSYRFKQRYYLYINHIGETKQKYQLLQQMDVINEMQTFIIPKMETNKNHKLIPLNTSSNSFSSSVPIKL